MQVFHSVLHRISHVTSSAHALCRSAALALCVAVTVASVTSHAAPTIGGATVTGLPVNEVGNRTLYFHQQTTMIGSFAMHGADAFSWDAFEFWAQQGYGQSLSAAQLLQDIYESAPSRANYPRSLLSEEFVRAVFRFLLDVSTPSQAAVDYWLAQYNTFRANPMNRSPEGQLIRDMANSAIGASSNDPIAIRFYQRLQAALLIKREIDTAAERNPNSTGASVFAVSRPRIVPITDAASYGTATAPVARLNWLIDQSEIPAAATYNAASGVLTVNGSQFVSVFGANNDIDLSKITLYGDGAPYALTSGFAEITSASSFQVALNPADRFALSSRINRDGTLSRGNVKYLLAASQGWNGASDPQLPDALTGSRITASGTAVPLLNIDNSDAATAYDAATDGVLLLRYLLGVRGNELIANARGTGANLRSAAEIEAMLGAFIMTNPAQSPFDVDGDGVVSPLTDGLMILRRMLNPSVASSDSAAMSAITAGAKRGTRTDAQVVNAIDALKP